MARIFTIRFIYNGNVHHAMIGVRETPFYVEYKLSMLDEHLMSQLPADKLYASETGEIRFANASGNALTPLMKEIIQAISEHMHQVQT